MKGDEARKRLLIALIQSQNVNMDARYHKTNLTEVIKWCKFRFGTMRPHHPIFEAEDGWLDYFEGNWAMSFKPDGPGTVWMFWFEKQEDLVEFKLCWM